MNHFNKNRMFKIVQYNTFNKISMNKSVNKTIKMS